MGMFDDLMPGAPAGPGMFDDLPKPKPAGMLRKLADKGLGFASGAVGATKAIADATGAGNRVSGALGTANEFLNDNLSAEAKADQQQQSAILDAAKGQGAWEGVKAGARAFGVAPVQTAVQGLGSIVPIIAGTALTGGAAPAAAVGAGIGAAMGLGTAKGAIYDEIKKRGGTDAEATKAQEYGGANTDQIALGGALGTADALTGVSGIAGGMIRRAVGKPVADSVASTALNAIGKKPVERGIIGRAGMGMLGEMPLEAAQGGQEQLAANIAAQRAGYQAGTWDNVASNATLEALASAGPGAVFGAMDRQSPATQPPPAQTGTPPAQPQQTPGASPAQPGTLPENQPPVNPITGQTQPSVSQVTPGVPLSKFETNAKGEFPDGPSPGSDAPKRWKTQGVYRDGVPALGDRIREAYYSGNIELAQSLADQLPDPQDDWEYRYFDGVRLASSVVGGVGHLRDLTVRGMPLELWQNDVSAYKSTAPKRNKQPPTETASAPVAPAAPVVDNVFEQARKQFKENKVQELISQGFSEDEARQIADGKAVSRPAPTPAQQAGIDANAGPLSAAAATAVNAGITPITQSPVAQPPSKQDNIKRIQEANGATTPTQLLTDASALLPSNQPLPSVVATTSPVMAGGDQAAQQASQTSAFGATQPDSGTNQPELGTNMLGANISQVGDKPQGNRQAVDADQVQADVSQSQAPQMPQAEVGQSSTPQAQGLDNAGQKTEVLGQGKSSVNDTPTAKAEQAPVATDGVAQPETPPAIHHEWKRIDSLTRGLSAAKADAAFLNKNEQYYEYRVVPTDTGYVIESRPKKKNTPTAPASAPPGATQQPAQPVTGQGAGVSQPTQDVSAPIKTLKEGLARLRAERAKNQQQGTTSEKAPETLEVQTERQPQGTPAATDKPAADAGVAGSAKEGVEPTPKLSDVEMDEAEKRLDVEMKLIPGSIRRKKVRDGAIDALYGKKATSIHPDYISGYKWGEAQDPTKPAIVTDKAEMRPYRKPDGSVGYEAVPIQVETPAPETTDVQATIKSAVSVDGLTNDQVDQVAAMFGIGKQKAPEAPAKPTYGASNTLVTMDARDKIKARMKAKLNRLNSGIDPELLSDGIQLGVFHLEAGVRSFIDLAKAIAADLDTPVVNLKRYLRAWYNGARDMMEDAGLDVSDMDNPDAVKKAISEIEKSSDIEVPTTKDKAKPTLETTEGRHEIAKLVADHLITSKFSTIIEARKFITDKTGVAIEPGTDAAKRADEAIELGVVLASRDVVQAARKQGRSDTVIFDRLIGIHDNQPSLNVRDSVSLRNQAYSTPVPLAFVASRLAGVTPDKLAGEPTAGNGALMMEADPATSTVNEIQDDRLEALKSQGFSPSQNDAATMAFNPKSLDSMVMNPPFGAVNGQKWTFGKFTTGEIDHAIALNSLEALKDDGDAVMIIGGTLAREDAARKDAYRGKAKREFFYKLYSEYNVVDHFTVSGDLYKKQGAAYPVDVLVIKGRGKSSRGLPAAQLPQLIDTWSQLKEKLNEAESMGTNGSGGTRGGASDTNASNEPGQLPVDPVRPPTDSVGGQPGGNQSGIGSVDGGGVTPDSTGAGKPTKQGGKSDTLGQRGNDSSSKADGNTRTNAKQGTDSQQSSRGSNQSNKPSGVGTESSQQPDSPGIADVAESGRLQVKYGNFSSNRSVNTLVATNHLSAIENAFNRLKDRVGDIDEFVRAELQYEPEQFDKSFSAEQVEALALAIDNIGQGKGFIIGDQTGIGKGRVVAAMIRYAKLNGKVPVFVTQMPDLYGDMMRDLNDIGMGKTKPLMTNNNASVPLDAEALAWFGEKQGIETRITELNDAIEVVAVQDLGGKLEKMDSAERAKAIKSEIASSKNPEIVSLKEEVTELKASKPARKGKFLDTPDIKTHEDALSSMVASNSIGDHDVIFTTYNQMAALDSGKPKKDAQGRKTPASQPTFGYRNTFLKHFINNNTMLILDESHNAGAAGDGKFPKLGDIVRGLINQSGGVFYSSATFAKNTEVMDVYSKTDLGSAFSTPADLVRAVNSVPMQQITSAMLVDAGQYLRRERSFDGIEYKTETVDVDQQASENLATAMRLVVAFDEAKKASIADIQNDLDAQGAAISTINGGGSSASVESTNFTSVMHNVVGTFLLALKADATAKLAVDAIRNGEKPIITVANTMEMFITEYAKEAGIGIGDKLNASFADVMKRYLDKTRMARIRDSNGDTEVIWLEDSQLGPDGVAAYEEALDFIENMDMDIPLSPIDHIKQRIQEAGFSIGEITGRQTVVENGVLKGRDKSEMKTAGKKNTISKYNGGSIDALIINRSGSTGLSMHASATFADQRRRVMIVAQAELDINNHMQMLGRINRTGQVTTGPFDAGLAGSYQGRPAQYGLPRYAQMTANVPIELRPAAVLSNKMAGLNANTTAGRNSAVEDKAALDFMNKYGDRVAAELIGNDYNLNASLGFPIRFDDHGDPLIPGSMGRVTGRIGLLPLAKQSELYKQLSNEYSDLLSQLDALGQNDLEAKTYPLDAQTLESKVVSKADKGSESPFTSEVVAEKVSMKKIGKPYPKAKVLELVSAALDGKDARQLQSKTVTDVKGAIDAEIQVLNTENATADPERKIGIKKHIESLQAAALRFRQTLPPIGVSVQLKTSAGNMYGVITGVERSGKAKSAGSLSAWKVRIAVVDGARSMTLPLTQIYINELTPIPENGIVMYPATEMTITNAEKNGFERVPVLDAFDRGQTDSRETRIVITGNILRGYGTLRGRLLNYTDNKGGIKQGILMPPDFDMDAASAKFTPSLKDAAAAIDLLKKGGTVIDKANSGDTLRIVKTGQPYIVEVSKTGIGKRLSKNANTNLNFVSAGNKMRVRIWNDQDLTDFIDNTVKAENVYLIPDANSVKLVDDGAPKFSRATTTKPTTVSAIQKAVRQLTGRLTPTRNLGHIVATTAAEIKSTWEPLIDKRINIDQTGNEGKAQAFFDPQTKTIFLIADNIEAGTETAVLAHELVHKHGKPVLGEIGWNDLHSVIESWSNAAEGTNERKVYDFAAERVNAIGAELSSEELFPYAVEAAFRLGIKPNAIARTGTVAKWLAKVKQALREVWDKVVGNPKTFDSQDLVNLAYGIAQREMHDVGPVNGGGIEPIQDIRYSRASNALNSVRDMNLPAGYKVADLINSAPGKLGWWHKSIGTMYNLAQKSPEFKRVFDGVQTFINDVSYFANESANLAPKILPKLETLKDVWKSPVSSADTKAFSAPVFEGTLSWGRDKAGNAVKISELEAAAASLTVDQKARRLVDEGYVQNHIMRMWQGLPAAQYEVIVNSKFENDILKPGVVFSDDELRQHFNLTQNQIDLYREFRATTDKSLANLAIADMIRFGGLDVAPIRDTVLESDSVTDAAEMLADYLRSLIQLDPDRTEVLNDTASKMADKAKTAQDLMDRGYAPLSRFGQYTLDVVDNGERVYFGMFESKWDASKMQRTMKADYPNATITQGTLSEQSYKLFAGVSPETLALFGDMLGLEQQGDTASAKAFQEYLKLAKSSRSAMKRLLHRKGIAGFNEDAGRVLAGFVYSNARQTSTSLHMGELVNAVNEVPQQQGQLKDAAVRLFDYIKNPQEEAQAIRGLLFTQYIGGSIASAMVNLTQPITMTLPWLSQYGGAVKASKQMAAAVKDAYKSNTGDAGLDKALKLAEEKGIVSPQEVHQLMKQAQGQAALTSGDGTKLGDSVAMAKNAMSRFMLTWGKPFSWAEQMNRRVTFIAAYRTAISEGMTDPMAFAEKAIDETQGVYNKGNKPAWARGALGSTLFTFKQYSIAYVEMLQRMAKNGPEGKKAALLALGILFLLSGASGLPGSDDLDDIISGALQSMGYNFDSKQKRKEFFASMVGEDGARFMERGLSALPGVPIDVAGRMGLGNLIPSTGLFVKKQDHTRDVAEIFGPAGDLAKRAYDATGKLISGQILGVHGAIATAAPKAMQNLSQSFDMANMGMYRDQNGKKIIDTDASDALVKALGFQPNDVARVQSASFDVQRIIGINKMRETEIADKWAKGLFENDSAKVQDARDELSQWNSDNPESPIRIKFPQIMHRVRSMRQSKDERIAKTAPKEIRASVKRELALQ